MFVRNSGVAIPISKLVREMTKLCSSPRPSPSTVNWHCCSTERGLLIRRKDFLSTLSAGVTFNAIRQTLEEQDASLFLGAFKLLHSTTRRPCVLKSYSTDKMGSAGQRDLHVLIIRSRYHKRTDSSRTQARTQKAKHAPYPPGNHQGANAPKPAYGLPSSTWNQRER